MTGSRSRLALQGRTPQYGLWVTLGSPSITEVAIDLGFDWEEMVPWKPSRETGKRLGPWESGDFE